MISNVSPSLKVDPSARLSNQIRQLFMPFTDVITTDVLADKKDFYRKGGLYKILIERKLSSVLSLGR